MTIFCELVCRRYLRVFLISLVFFCTISHSWAAEIRRVTLPEIFDKGTDLADGPVILISGKITKGDAQKFLSIAADILAVTPKSVDMGGYYYVALEGKGGDYFEAIEIIKVIRAHALQTIVSSTSECSSACAFIFLSGRQERLSVEGISSYEPARHLYVGGSIVFHSPFTDLSSGRFDEGVRAVRMLRDSLRDALPDSLFLLAIEKGQDEGFEVRYVADVIDWDIEFHGLWRKKIDIRSMLYNACVNKLIFKDDKYYYHNSQFNLINPPSNQTQFREPEGRYGLNGVGQPKEANPNWLEIDMEALGSVWSSQDFEDEDKDHFRLKTTKDKSQIYTRIGFSQSDEMLSTWCTAIMSAPQLDPETKLWTVDPTGMIWAAEELTAKAVRERHKPVSAMYLFPGGMRLSKFDRFDS